MFCEKCGAQIPDDAKFCEHCGNSTEPGAPAAAEMTPAAPAAPSAFGIALKKFFSKKKNIAIVAAALLAVIAIIVTIVIIASLPKKIYLDDYFTVEFDGVNGYGEADIEWDDDMLEELNEKIFGEDYEHDVQYLITPVFVTTDDEKDALKNGEEITVKLEFDDEAKKLLDGYKFVLRESTVKVSGLKELTEVSVIKDFPISFEGVDGYGRLTLSKNSITVGDYTLNFNYWSGESYNLNVEIYEEEKLLESLSFKIDNLEGLSNGDTVVISASDDETYDINKLIRKGVKLVDYDQEIKVSGLEEPTLLDLTGLIPFKGVSGYAKIASNATIQMDGYHIETYVSSYNSYVELCFYNSNGYYVDEIRYYVNKTEGITNGDDIAFMIDSDDGFAALKEELLIYLSDSFTVTATGLEEPTTFDPSSNLTATFNGYSGVATIDVTVKDVNTGTYSADIEFYSGYYSDTYIKVTFYDTYGNYIDSIYYYADKEENFANGDLVTFAVNSGEDFSYIASQLGIIPVESFSFTVADLVIPTIPDVLGKGTFTLTGYNNYGKVNYTIADENCVYTLDGYTFKITPSTSGNYITLNVVVANASGENFISLNYSIYTGYNLSNGDTLTVYCDEYESTLESYLDTYGIYFPYSVEYSISGLTDATLVKPLDYVTFSTVAGENGPEMVVTLKQESFTVNGYTVALSLSSYSGWYSDYINIDFTVTDESGNECGSGYYQIESNNLYEGETVTTSLYGSDFDELEGIYGLKIDSERVSVIVSTK